MSNILRSGSKYFVSEESDIQLTPYLPAGTYKLLYDQMKGFYLEKMPDFSLPEKIYGNTEERCERIISTFQDRETSMGVHLTGVKGSGKTMLAKLVSVQAAEKLDMPTVVINMAYEGEDFRSFIQGIGNPCVILFDEFEKVYGREEQHELLTLLDGVYNSQKLFLLTSNSGGYHGYGTLSEYLFNRPGRIYYEYKYDDLEEDFIREYCEDTLTDKSKIDSIVAGFRVFRGCNFDVLSAVVQEMNRYGEDFFEVTEHLNVGMNISRYSKHDIILRINGKDFETIGTNYQGYDPCEFSHKVFLDLDDLDLDDAGCVEEVLGSNEVVTELRRSGCIEFSTSDIVDFEHSTGTYTYRKGNVELVVKESLYNTFDYKSFV